MHCEYFVNENGIDYDFGFICKNGSILCKVNPGLEEVSIKHISFHKNSTDGKTLIELVTQKAVEMNYKYLSALVIGDSKLVNLYKREGFEVISEMIYLYDKENKTRNLKKRL
uniref:N-acetyltransferase domain-containing protein n=1 Tax=viral metagenome TaxID=1070528 RepID=A0A6C0DRK6_9ZZZZ